MLKTIEIKLDNRIILHKYINDDGKEIGAVYDCRSNKKAKELMRMIRKPENDIAEILNKLPLNVEIDRKTVSAMVAERNHLAKELVAVKEKLVFLIKKARIQRKDQDVIDALFSIHNGIIDAE